MFRDGFIDVLVDVRRVNDARIIELVQAFRKNGLQGVQVFESADQMPDAARYVWVKGLSYVKAYKTDPQREEPRRLGAIRLPVHVPSAWTRTRWGFSTAAFAGAGRKVCASWMPASFLVSQDFLLLRTFI